MAIGLNITPYLGFPSGSVTVHIDGRVNILPSLLHFSFTRLPCRALHQSGVFVVLPLPGARVGDAPGSGHWVVLNQENAEAQPPTWARPGVGEDAKAGETIPAVKPIYLNNTQAWA